MISPHFTFKAKVWLYTGKAAWHFITVPKNQSTTIKELFGDVKRGWGSLPVDVKIGNTDWTTSIFPDSKAGTYVLPLKAAVRKSEGITENKTVTVSITIKV